MVRSAPYGRWVADWRSRFPGPWSNTIVHLSPQVRYYAFEQVYDLTGFTVEIVPRLIGPVIASFISESLVIKLCGFHQEQGL